MRLLVGSKSVGDPIISSGNQVFLWEAAGGEAEDQPLVLRQSGHESDPLRQASCGYFVATLPESAPAFADLPLAAGQPLGSLVQVSSCLQSEWVPPRTEPSDEAPQTPRVEQSGRMHPGRGGQVIQGLGSFGSGMQNKVAIQQASLPNHAQCGLISETS